MLNCLKKHGHISIRVHGFMHVQHVAVSLQMFAHNMGDEPQDVDVGAIASAASTAAASCQPEMSEDWGFHVSVVEWYYDFKGMECLSR